MAFDRVICPTCLTAEFDELAPAPLRAVRCKSCGLGIECRVRIDRDAYERYHETRDGGGKENETPLGRWHHDFAVAVDRIRQLKDHIPRNGPWLDVGCNAGAVLAAARRFGYRPFGVEISRTAAGAAVEATGCPVEVLDRWMRSEGTYIEPNYSVVSLFDVIEHAVDPGALVDRSVRALKAFKSALVIEVPDLDGTDAGSFPHWKHRRISKTFTEHVYHFCEKSLRKLVEQCAPNLTRVHVARPIAGRLQMVFCDPAAQK